MTAMIVAAAVLLAGFAVWHRATAARRAAATGKRATTSDPDAMVRPMSTDIYRGGPDAQALAAAVRRLPTSRTAPVEDVIACWRADPPRAARQLLALPADEQAATWAALGYVGEGAAR